MASSAVARRSSAGRDDAALAPAALPSNTQQAAAESPASPQPSVWPPGQSELYGVDDIASIPACIRAAVIGFRPTPTCTPLLLPRNHRSITFKYGMRVNCVFRGAPVVGGGLCMASDACRRKCTFLQLHGGKRQTQQSTCLTHIKFTQRKRYFRQHASGAVKKR